MPPRRPIPAQARLLGLTCIGTKRESKDRCVELVTASQERAIRAAFFCEVGMRDEHDYEYDMEYALQLGVDDIW